MNLGLLSFLCNPYFVVPWYVVGILGALWIIYDEYNVNVHVQPALKWAWPIIAVFFSVFGVALYWWTCRPSRIEDTPRQEQEHVHHEYVDTMFRRVTGAVIHCVAGDGAGIVTAMVIARHTGMSFWQEFWFEYAAGFAFGWFIFQYKAMSKMAGSVGKALWMGGRAEFFSMITVMAGMGIGMGYITPLVAGEQPKADTFAFWGFASLGLFIGFLATYPMNWILVKMEWKHGMG